MNNRFLRNGQNNWLKYIFQNQEQLNHNELPHLPNICLRFFHFVSIIDPNQRFLVLFLHESTILKFIQQVMFQNLFSNNSKLGRPSQDLNLCTVVSTKSKQYSAFLSMASPMVDLRLPTNSSTWSAFLIFWGWKFLVQLRTLNTSYDQVENLL